MKKFYFTFGLGHKNHNRYQVIFAKTEQAACEKMSEIYGRQWAFCYNHEQWAMTKQEGYFNDLLPNETAFAI